MTTIKIKSLSDFKGSTDCCCFFPWHSPATERKNYAPYLTTSIYINNHHAVVIGIPVDSLYTLSGCRKDQRLNFPLLSDFNKNVSDLYGCLCQHFGNMNMKGVAKRASFVIDKAGVIRFAEILRMPATCPILPIFIKYSQLWIKIEKSP